MDHPLRNLRGRRVRQHIQHRRHFGLGRSLVRVLSPTHHEPDDSQGPAQVYQEVTLQVARMGGTMTEKELESY